MTAKGRAQALGGSRVKPAEARQRVATILAKTSPIAKLKNANEADTRIQVVDQILEALGWAHDDVERERSSGAGDYLDYELRAGKDAWMVVEAKRAGTTFDLQSLGKHTGDGRLRSISTLIARGGQALRDVMKQAAGYCNDRGIPLACVTNGYEWTFFRGLSRHARPWNKGTAIVFSGIDDIQGRFNDFLGCLGRDWAGRAFLPELLDRNDDESPQPRVPRDLLLAPPRPASAESIAEVRGVCERFLSDIHRSADNEMLERCYVRPGMAGDFDHAVRRLLKDTEERIANDAQPLVASSIEPDRFAMEVTRQEEANPIRDPIVVAGHVGAGKTTFLHRAIAYFREEGTAICALVDLTGYGHGGTINAADEERRVAEKVLEQLGRTGRSTLRRTNPDVSEGDLKHADPYSAETLRTLLRDDIAREQELGARLWATDPSAWDRREYEMVRDLRSDPLALLPRYIRQLRARFKRSDGKRFSLLIVLDNLDQATDEYQRCIYGFAERLSRQTPAVVVVCIREDTFHSGRKADGFLSSSSLSGVYHVASPPLDHVLRQRVGYARLVIAEKRLPRGQRDKDAVISGVCDLLDRSLTPPRSEGTEILAGLAGHNMRDALALVTSVVEGAQSTPSTAEPSGAFVLDCLVRARADAGALGRTRLIDLFDAPPSSPPCHALRARLLSYYAWTHEQDARALLEDTERVLGRFATWGYPAWVVRDALKHLREGGALRGRGFEEDEADTLPPRLSITASGFVHVTRLLDLKPYRTAMALTTRWYDSELFDRFVDQAEAAGGASGSTVADMELSPAVDFFEAYLAKTVRREDGQLVRSQVHSQSWIPEVLGRARAVVRSTRPPSVLPPAPSQPAGTRRRPARPEAATQMELAQVVGGEASPTATAASMPSLPRDTKYDGTVWTPRILWALEWGRRAGRPRLTAADIARILAEHAQLDVPGENVARAFREQKKRAGGDDLWKCSGRRYEITNAGTLLLRAVLEAGSSSG